MEIVLHKKQPESRSRTKKELYKLLIARSDITASLNTCKLLLEKVDGMGHELYYPFYTAIVTCYCRPFTQNKPYGALGKKWYSFEDEVMKDTHESLLDARHELIAHSDMNVKEAIIVPPGVKTGPDGDDQIVSDFIGVTTMHYFPRPMFEKTYNLCLYQGTRINTEIDILIDRLYRGMELPNAPFKIRINDGL